MLFSSYGLKTFLLNTPKKACYPLFLCSMPMSKYTTFLKKLYKVFGKFKYPQIWKVNNAIHIRSTQQRRNHGVNNHLSLKYLSKRILSSHFGITFLNIHLKSFILNRIKISIYYVMLNVYSNMLDTPLQLLRKILRDLQSKRVLSKH